MPVERRGLICTMYAVLATLAVHIFGAPATIPAVVGSFCG